MFSIQKTEECINILNVICYATLSKLTLQCTVTVSYQMAGIQFGYVTVYLNLVCSGYVMYETISHSSFFSRSVRRCDLHQNQS